MEDDNNWHYRIPTIEEVKQSFEELGIKRINLQKLLLNWQVQKRACFISRRYLEISFSIILRHRFLIGFIIVVLQRQT